MKSKSQASLEFLTTYAWAFLAIMIALGALYYFGVLDFAKFLPQECSFPSQFECNAFAFAGSSPAGEIRFNLVNNIGEIIRVKSFAVTNEDVTPLACDTAAASIAVKCGDAPAGDLIAFDWNPGLDCEFTIPGCSSEAFKRSERTNAEITMVYCATLTSGCPATADVDHVVKGAIEAVVT